MIRWSALILVAGVGAGILIGGLRAETAATESAASEPATATERSGAQRMRDLRQMRPILMACEAWADAHGNQMPEDLATLVLEKDLDAKELVRKGSGTKALEVSDDMREKGKKDPAAFEKLLEQHTDYVYVGNGMNVFGPDGDFVQSLVTLYEKPGGGTGSGIALGYRDGHEEFIFREKLGEAFRLANVFRAKRGMKELDMEGIVKALESGK